MRRKPNEQGETATRAEVSRMGQLWVGGVLAAAVLGLLLAFVLQNDQSVTLSFLWLTGQLPLGVALLLAAVAGVLIVAVPGTVRILQLRRQVQHRPRPPLE